MSPRSSVVSQLTLRPPDSLAQRPLGDDHDARAARRRSRPRASRHSPRALNSTTSSPCGDAARRRVVGVDLDDGRPRAGEQARLAGQAAADEVVRRPGHQGQPRPLRARRRSRRHRPCRANRPGRGSRPRRASASTVQLHLAARASGNGRPRRAARPARAAARALRPAAGAGVTPAKCGLPAAVAVEHLVDDLVGASGAARVRRSPSPGQQAHHLPVALALAQRGDGRARCRSAASCRRPCAGRSVRAGEVAGRTRSASRRCRSGTVHARR